MTKELFKKFLDGRCTEEEFDEILRWVGEEAEKDRELVFEIWNSFHPDHDARKEEDLQYRSVLERIHGQINSEAEKRRQIPKKRKRLLTSLTRIAAVLLLPVSLLLLYKSFPDTFAFFGNYKNNISELEVTAPAGSTISLELGDGTKVWLNHGSKLKYPYRFEGNKRTVSLEGEGYFDVTPDKRKPFYVHAGGITVKAVGTAFNVNAWSDEKRVETTLVEGKVILYNRDGQNELKILNPGEIFKYDVNSDTYTVDSENSGKYVAWKDGLLIFKNDPMEQVAKKLGRWFNTEVRLEGEAVRELTFTATFQGETLQQVVELMQLATPVNCRLSRSEKLANDSFSRQKLVIGMKQ